MNSNRERQNLHEKEDKDLDYVKAFLIGGIICALVQILLDRTKLMPGRVMVLLVCTGAVLGFCNIYKPFQECPSWGSATFCGRA